MILRFAQGSKVDSYLIAALEKVAMPFTPTHVEAQMPDGTLIGSRFDGGVQRREAGYDAAYTAYELFLTLPAEPAMDFKFHAWLEGKIGTAYDWPAILGFVLPSHRHTPEHAICSALIVLGLRACGWFQYPLAAPAHLINPRDLLLLVSGRVRIPM